jgi:CheY-like chemotaxis protein
VTGASDEAVLEHLAADGHRPDLIISDYQLAAQRTGLEAIAQLRCTLGGLVPALLISGDTAPERLRVAKASGHQLLYKPVAPATLRATLNHLLRDRGRAAKP